MARPSWDQTFIEVAQTLSRMGTCARRQVGAVITTDRNVILSTGFNGVPPGWGHCRDNPEFECTGSKLPSGTGLDQCKANHAEVNAIIHCPDVNRAHVCYTTTSPCVSCVKALLCTGISRIVFLDEYPQPEARQLWCSYPVTVKSLGRPRNEHRTWWKFDENSGEPILIDSSGFKR